MQVRKKPTSYSDFTLTDLADMFGITNDTKHFQFTKASVQPSAWLLQTLDMQKSVPKGTEKSKSEHLLVPILMELHQRNLNKFRYFSGYSFEVDAEKSLRGRCDFLLSKGKSMEIGTPVFGIFEAKDDSIDHYHGQCGSEMYAAYLFNQQQNHPINLIYGAITDGINWKFMYYENYQLWIDTEYYGLQNLPVLLGVLQEIIDFYE